MASNTSPASARPVRNFGPLRRLSEHVQDVLTPSDWPAALADRLGLTARLRVRHDAVTVHASPGSASRLRIAFASDFHAGPSTSPRLLADAIEALHHAAADVLLLGGDFVAVRARGIDALAARLGEVPAPAGRFAVLGNHDYYAGAARITAALERAGVQVLVNRSTRLPAPFDRVSICGLDDHTSGHPDAAAAFASAASVRVLLMHAPSGLLDVGRHAFDLALAGHTHGGQVALPGGRPIVVPKGRLSRRYAGGRYELAPGRALLVTRGLGQSVLPLRWHAPPEVHVLSMEGPGERRGSPPCAV